MNISFTDEAWNQYVSWLIEDKKMILKINKLIHEIKSNPFHGIGKPEPLRFDFKGYWSRRIDKEHRIVYKIDKENIYIISCKYHYDD